MEEHYDEYVHDDGYHSRIRNMNITLNYYIWYWSLISLYLKIYAHMFYGFIIYLIISWLFKFYTSYGLESIIYFFILITSKF